MTDESDNDPKDVFSDDESQIVHTIMLLRLYDVMMCVARGVNPDEAVKLLALHQQGKIAGPPPFFDMGDEVTETDDVENEG